MTSELTKEQKDQFEKLFYSFDTDKDGESRLLAIKLVKKESSFCDNTIKLTDETMFSPYKSIDLLRL